MFYIKSTASRVQSELQSQGRMHTTQNYFHDSKKMFFVDPTIFLKIYLSRLITAIFYVFVLCRYSKLKLPHSETIMF